MVNKMNKVTKAMVITFITNLILSFLQVIIGMIGNSAAVVADGVHTITDLITDVVAIIGSKLSNKRANQKHPFGYGQIEYITSVFIGVVVMAMGLYLISTSVEEKLIIPHVAVIIVTIITIVSKYVLYRYVLAKGKEYRNSILLASSQESLVDVISSFVVLISIVLMQFSDQVSIFIYADRLAAVAVSLFVIKTGFSIMSENIGHLIGEQETNETFINEIKDIFLKDSKILSIEKLIVIKSGPYYKLDAEVIMEGNLTLKVVYKTIDKIKKELKKTKKVKYINIIADLK
jgi:cation diffusion facilitator family transporter